MYDKPYINYNDTFWMGMIMSTKIMRLTLALMVMVVLFTPIINAAIVIGKYDKVSLPNGATLVFERQVTAKSARVSGNILYLDGFRWENVYYSSIGFYCSNPSVTLTFTEFTANTIKLTVSGGQNGVLTNCRVYLPKLVSAPVVVGKIDGWGWNSAGLISIMVRNYPCQITITK